MHTLLQLLHQIGKRAVQLGQEGRQINAWHACLAGGSERKLLLQRCLCCNSKQVAGSTCAWQLVSDHEKALCLIDTPDSMMCAKNRSRVRTHMSGIAARCTVVAIASSRKSARSCVLSFRCAAPACSGGRCTSYRWPPNGKEACTSAAGGGGGAGRTATTSAGMQALRSHLAAQASPVQHHALEDMLAQR